jgi:hypothetical protein
VVIQYKTASRLDGINMQDPGVVVPRQSRLGAVDTSDAAQFEFESVATVVWSRLAYHCRSPCSTAIVETVDKQFAVILGA